MKKKRQKPIGLAAIGFASAASLSFWWWYMLFTSDTCEPNGLKLAIVIIPLCVTFTEKVAAIVPLIFGLVMTVAFYFTVTRKW